MKRLRLGALLLAALVGPTFLPDLSAEPRYGGTLKVALWFDVTHLNPFADNRSTDDAVRSVIFEGLIDWARDLSIVPSIAESWTISRDGKLYTFKIRKGIKFHNGKDLTSEDVKWSLEYIGDSKNGAYKYSAFQVIDAIEDPDPYTIRVRLKSPLASFLSDIGTSQAPITPRGSVIERRPKTFPPGTGPFEFVEWKPSQLIRLKKNPNYWQKGVPYLDEIEMRPIPDEQIRFAALRSREVDMVDKIPFAEAKEILKGALSGLGISTGEAAGHYRLRMNVRKPPLSDVRVRQAIAYALNKQDIVEAVSWGLGKAIYWRYPRNTRWFIELEDRKQDGKRAKALLEDAGYAQGFRVNAPIHSGSLSAGQVVKAQLEKIGVDMNLQIMDRGAYRDRIAKRDYDIVLSGGGLAPDPDSLLYDAFHSRFVNHQNESGYQNPELDRILEEARVISEFDKRKLLYTDALRVLVRDVPEIPLYTYPWIFGFRNNVKGFEAEETRGVFSFNANKGGMPVTWIDR